MARRQTDWRWQLRPYALSFIIVLPLLQPRDIITLYYVTNIEPDNKLRASALISVINKFLHDCHCYCYYIVGGDCFEILQIFFKYLKALRFSCRFSSSVFIWDSLLNKYLKGRVCHIFLLIVKSFSFSVPSFLQLVLHCCFHYYCNRQSRFKIICHWVKIWVQSLVIIIQFSKKMWLWPSKYWELFLLL